MTFKEHITKEFQLRVFDESYQRIYKCLSALDDTFIWDSPNGNVPAIGCLILHLCGNARQWVLSGVGGQPDNRIRDDEFMIHKDIRKADFVLLMEQLKSQLNAFFETMQEEQLEKTITVQGFEVTGFSALVHVIEHFSYHTGQITTLTKIYANQDLGYYSGLNLNIKDQLN